MTTPPDSSRWLAERKHHVGASEVAAVLGVSPWSSGYDVWARKTGRIPADLANPEAEERMQWGTLLEPTILAETERRTGRRVVPAPQDVHVLHPRVAVLSCTPDGYVEDDGLAECKTSLGYGARQVWEEGVPLHYQIQVQQQLAVTGRAYGLLAVLRTGPVLELHRIERHEGAIAMIEEVIPEWWERHVVADIPPPVDAHPATVRALEALHRGSISGVIDLPDESEEWARLLEDIKAKRTQLDEDERAVKAQIKAAIGAAEAGRLPGGGGWTWRVVERKEHTVKASSHRELRRVKKL